jgi:uncharacterized MAPEG superfamily protein
VALAAVPDARGGLLQRAGQQVGTLAVVLALQLGAPQATLDILALLFVTLRIIYIVMYVADLPLARSGIWSLALLVNIGILFIGWR